MTDNLTIRWMISKDRPAVMKIEKESFEFPWYEEDFVRCLRQRHTMGLIAEPKIPVRGKHPLMGYAIYEFHKTRIHILNMAVAPEYRFNGVGRAIVEKLINKLNETKNIKRVRVTLEVRETNLAAQLFFKACGFKATTVLHSYYEDSPEDAFVMQYHVDDHKPETRKAK